MLYAIQSLLGYTSVSYVLVTQAYTSQFVALIMFGLMMSEDKLSLQKRRLEIISGLKVLPGQCPNELSYTATVT